MASHYFIDTKCEGVPHSFEAVTREGAESIIQGLRLRWVGKTWTARLTKVRVTRSNPESVVEYSSDSKGAVR